MTCNPKEPVIDRLYPSDWEGWAQVAADKYGGDPDVYIAIACLESGYGKSKLARENNNFHGIRNVSGGGFSSFLSPVQSFTGCAYLLQKSRFYEDARGNLDKIGKIYCPPDPHWSIKVRAILKTIKQARGE